MFFSIFNPLPHRRLLMLLQTEQTQIRQLLLELPDLSLLCKSCLIRVSSICFMEIWLDMALHLWIWQVFFFCFMYQHEILFIYIIIHSGWSLAWIFMKERVKRVYSVKNFPLHAVDLLFKQLGSGSLAALYQNFQELANNMLKTYLTLSFMKIHARLHLLWIII